MENNNEDIDNPYESGERATVASTPQDDPFSLELPDMNFDMELPVFDLGF